MIVVALGHRLVTPSIHPHLRRRVDRAVDALRETDASWLLCSGGRRNESVARTEADVMATYARRQGVPDRRLALEERSLDTIGNGYYVRRLLDRRGIEPETIQLVTAADHVERAAFVFRQCFPEVAIETDYVAEPRTPDSRFPDDDRLERTRAFFEPIEPGDVEAIERRLIEDHDCYSNN